MDRSYVSYALFSRGVCRRITHWLGRRHIALSWMTTGNLENIGKINNIYIFFQSRLGKRHLVFSHFISQLRSSSYCYFNQNYMQDILKYFLFFSYTYSSYSELGRRNPALRYSDPHATLTFWDIACWVAKLNAALFLFTLFVSKRK